MNRFEHRASAYSYFTRVETKITYYEHRIGFYVKLEISVKVSHCAHCRVFHSDRRADEWLTEVINNLSLDLDGLILCYCCHCRHWAERNAADGSQA